MRVKVLRNKILSVVVSLALSFFLWLAVAGQDTSAIDLPVPLELQDLPADLALKGEVPATVTVQVLVNAAQGRFLADRKLELRLDVAAAREGANAFPVDAESLALPRGVSVRKISPAVIDFETIRVSRKVLPLTPITEGRPEAAYRVRTLTLEPDRVTVTGPKERVESLEFLPTTPIILTGLSRDTSQMVTPALADFPGLTVTPLDIKASVTIEERWMEATFSSLPIAVDTKSGRKPQSLILTPDKADISVSWPVSRGRAVTAEEIRVKILVDEEALQREGTLTPPVVAVAPSGAAVTAITPVNVLVTRGAGPEAPSTKTPGASEGPVK